MYRIAAPPGTHTSHPHVALVAAHEPAHASVGQGAFESVGAAVAFLTAKRVHLALSAHDACYHKVKAQYAVFPSARASQAIAACRKKKGIAKKSEKGASLRRWQDEEWVDKKTGKPCGHDNGGRPEYCRPTRKKSEKTPTMYRGKTLKAQIAKKNSGKRATPPPKK